MEHCYQPKSALRFGKGFALLLGAIVSTHLCAACSNSGATKAQAPEGEEPQAPDEPFVERAKEDGKAPEEPVSTPSERQQDEGSIHSPTSTQNDADPIEKVLPESFDCSGLTCYRFERARQALVPLLLHEKAQLIAFGEAHAPATFRGRTTVRRFTEDLLPTISDGSTHLLLELLMPPEGGCEKEKAATQKESDQITEGQSKDNQNEYLTLGKRARSLGVVPDILRASCDDLKKIADPDGGVVAMMETVATLSAESLTKQLRNTKKGRPLVLAYGGANHNDASPRPGLESWSYGPTMIRDTKGKYLEIDLIVPELIKESWNNLPWYDAYRTLDHDEGVILMKWGDKSYSLFFAPEDSEAK